MSTGEELEVQRELWDETAGLPALADDTLIAVAEAAEKRIESVKKIRSLALKVTTARDWKNLGGEPYLECSGAEAIAGLFGISWRVSEGTRENMEDGHFSFNYTGIFGLGGRSIEAAGRRASSEKFFCTRKGQEIPASEVDEADVKMASYTNCIGNGVKRLLGIRNLTWEDLEAAGIKKENCLGVEYDNGSGKSTAAPSGNGEKKNPHPKALQKAHGLYDAFKSLLPEKVGQENAMKLFGDFWGEVLEVEVKGNSIEALAWQKAEKKDQVKVRIENMTDGTDANGLAKLAEMYKELESQE